MPERSLINRTYLEIITAASELPFFAMTEAIYDQRLREKLMRIGTATGLKIYPDELLFGIVKEFIMKDSDFRRLTAAQFEQAFMLNLSGTYGEIIEHFQSFDCVFIGKVLTAYIKLEYEAKDRLRHLKAKEPAPVVTDEQKEINHRQFLQSIINDFNKFCEGKLTSITAAKFKLIELEERKLIDETNKSKLYWLEKARKQREKDLSTEIIYEQSVFKKSLQISLNEIREGRLPTDGNQLMEVKNIARELCVKDYFRYWAETGFDLTGQLLTKNN